MLRGIQKNMIWVKTPESRFFESAYFVMRPAKMPKPPKEGEMLREANRLLSEGMKRALPHWKRRLYQLLLPFLFGLATGSLFVLLLLWLF